MKKGYKRLVVLLLFLFFILLVNTFLINILSKYIMVVFLIVVLLLFDFYYVIEKDKDKYSKEILFEIIFFTITYFILFYLLGLITGLAKHPNYLTLKGIKDILLPLILITILKEVLRYNMLSKADGSKLCTILVVLLFILFDISGEYYYASFKSQYEILRFVALTFLPTISRNISYSYISKKIGYKPVIIFSLIFSLYPYILPILPNPSEYVMSLIYLVVPISFALKIRNFIAKKKDDLIPSDYHKRKFKGILLPTIVILTLVYFYSGYFRYYAVAIASGSMTPNILKGDVVVLDQKVNKRNIKEGEVIGYKHNGLIIVHRVYNKIEKGNSYIYYTKGDANGHIDDLVIEEDMIVGVVKYKIPYIGYPTVWFNKE